jgi:hypothetical protein
MSEEHESTGEGKKAEKVIGVVFVAGDQSAEMVQPGKEPFDLPAFAIAAQRASIVARGLGASVAVGLRGRSTRPAFPRTFTQWLW